MTLDDFWWTDPVRKKKQYLMNTLSASNNIDYGRVVKIGRFFLSHNNSFIHRNFHIVEIIENQLELGM